MIEPSIFVNILVEISLVRLLILRVLHVPGKILAWEIDEYNVVQPAQMPSALPYIAMRRLPLPNDLVDVGALAEDFVQHGSYVVADIVTNVYIDSPHRGQQLAQKQCCFIEPLKI